MQKYIYCILALIIFIKCSKDDITKDKNGVVISQPPIWSVAQTDDDSLADNYYVRGTVLHENKVLICGRKNFKKLVKSIDITNGSVKWEWKDFVDPFRDNFSIRFPYKKDNFLTFFYDYDVYKIDLNTGKTVLKQNRYEDFGLKALGIGDIFLSSYLFNKDGALRGGGQILIVDNNNFNILHKFQPKYDTTNSIPFNDGGYWYWGQAVPFIKNGDTMVLVKSSDPATERSTVGNEWLNLYNLSHKKWIYERKNVKYQSTWGAGFPLLYKNLVFVNGVSWISCSDLDNGSLIWKNTTLQGGSFIFAGLLIINDKIYANSDDGQLFCLNAMNGQLIWQIRSSGSSTALSYLNGVVYFVGGGDGKLHAVDAETGEYLWKIESPDKAKNKWAIFSGMCAVVQGVGSEKGKILVTTGLNAYCYEAIR
jgi:outer membrane protein assembly factor BamB